MKQFGDSLGDRRLNDAAAERVSTPQYYSHITHPCPKSNAGGGPPSLAAATAIAER